MTASIHVWSGQSGTPDPITRPADPFASIPGAYDEDDYTPLTARTTTAPVERVITRTRVVDCPAYAWDNSDQPARDELGAAFYSLHRPELDAAAHELIRPLLIAEWRKHGRLCRLVDEAAFVAVPDGVSDYVDDKQRWTVWPTAAGQISGAELVFAAGLIDELAAWGER
jgi:hypothetical protein